MRQSEAQAVMECLAEHGPLSVEAIAEKTGIPLLKARSVIGYLRTSGRLQSKPVPVVYQITALGQAGGLRAYRQRQPASEKRAAPRINSVFQLGALA